MNAPKLLHTHDADAALVRSSVKVEKHQITNTETLDQVVITADVWLPSGRQFQVVTQVSPELWDLSPDLVWRKVEAGIVEAIQHPHTIRVPTFYEGGED